MSGFGIRLSMLREQRGLSRASLARLVEVTSPAVYNWEENDKVPRPGALAAICRVLGTSEDYLVRGIGVSEPNNIAKTADEIISEAKQALSIVLGLPLDRIQLKVQIDG